MPPSAADYDALLLRFIDLEAERNELAFKLGQEVARTELWMKRAEALQHRADVAEGELAKLPALTLRMEVAQLEAVARYTAAEFQLETAQKEIARLRRIEVAAKEVDEKWGENDADARYARLRAALSDGDKK